MGRSNELLEGCAISRQARAGAERIQTNTFAEIAGDHRQAGEPAFRSLLLQDDRYAAAPARAQQLRHQRQSIQ